MSLEPSGLLALYDKLWPMALAGLYWLFKRQEKHREATAAQFEARREMIAAHETRMSLAEQRHEILERRIAEDRETIKGDFSDIKKSLARIEERLEAKADK